MGAVSIAGSINQDNPTITWVEDGPWSWVYDVAFGYVGGWQSYWGFMTFWPPAYYIDIPSMICTGVDFSYTGAIDRATGDWSTARYTFKYAKPEHDEQSGVDLGELSLDFAAEALALPKDGGLQWDSGPDSGKAITGAEVNPKKIIPGVTIRLRRKSPWLLQTQILNAVGKINSVTLNVAGYGYGAERVLFAGCKAHKKYATDADELWEYDFDFVAMPHSWNSFYHKSGGFEYITPTVYDSYDHNYFFT